jgi:hypothetical protein
MKSSRALALALVAAAAVAGAAGAEAHVGSPDVFHEGMAGPYRLLVTIRPPAVVPGVAEIQIRSASADVSEVKVVPLLMTGPGSEYAPTPDRATRSHEDPQFFTGNLWLMTAGSWQIRILVSGDRGPGELSVPVPALPERTLGMQPALGAILAALALLLVVGIVAIAGAVVREGTLEPGSAPGAPEKRRARRVMVGATLLAAALLYLGNLWWGVAAGDYAEYVYKPVALEPSVVNGALRLKLLPTWSEARRVDDIVPDHAHLMHLFVVRLPEMEKLWHLHPDQRAPGIFEHALPAMPAGRYALFADIVHRTGLAETATAELSVPADTRGTALEGDDSAGEAPVLSRADTNATVSSIEGGRVVWEKPAKVRPREVQWLRFRVEDEAGKPAQDIELYMGMLGHLAILEKNRSVFAHIHPSGSVAMGALALIETPGAAPLCHEVATGTLPATVSFPYGFPKAGDYRLFLQIKRAGKIQTATFDTRIE